MTPSWAEGTPRIVDKLYGEISFPDFIGALLACPALMRLREIRMGNINFLCYPGFAETTRFEHSLGTCYLASLAAKKLGLSSRDTLTLMAAALYHDVATPPFAHATEDVFIEHFGFNHEEKLFEILVGKHTASRIAIGQYAPVFLGRRAILHRVCHSRAYREIDLNPIEIARVAHGEGILGHLISSDIDLDNLDNVVRAAMNMGFGSDPGTAIRLAMAFLIEDCKVHISPDNEADIRAWQKLRWRVYDGIFTDFKDFALQSMLKLAIVKAIDDGNITADHWCCTDGELLHVYLRRSEEADGIVERMRLGDLFETMLVVSTQGSSAKKIVTSPRKRRELEASVEKDFGFSCIINYYLDKRVRPLHMISHIEQPWQIMKLSEDNLIVGIFTPLRKTISAELKNKLIRSLSSVFGEDVSELREAGRIDRTAEALQGTFEIDG